MQTVYNKKPNFIETFPNFPSTGQYVPGFGSGYDYIHILKDGWIFGEIFVGHSYLNFREYFGQLEDFWGEQWFKWKHNDTFLLFL